MSGFLLTEYEIDKNTFKLSKLLNLHFKEFNLFFDFVSRVDSLVSDEL